MPEWLPSVIGGLLGALIGGFASLFVAERRLRADRRELAQSRSAERRAVARPAVIQLADLFTETEARFTPGWEESYFGPDETSPYDFSDYWGATSDRLIPKLLRLTLEVPDAVARDRIDDVVDGLYRSHSVHSRAPFGDHQTYVQHVCRIGAELVGAWLRDEEPDAGTLAWHRQLTAAVKQTEQELRR